MTDARRELDKAISDLIDDYVAKGVEPEPHERKIDGKAFTDWHKTMDGQLVLDRVNERINDFGTYREGRVDLVLYSPDTMRNVITLVNGFDEQDECQKRQAPCWLRVAIEQLRQRVIDAGFECDLEDVK